MGDFQSPLHIKVAGSSQSAVDREEYQPGSGGPVALPRNSKTNSESSFESLNSIESDRWSQRGISSKVSISLGDGLQPDENEDETKQCMCLCKLWGNWILPGILGIDDYRVVDKLFHKHPIAKQLLTNVATYNSIIRGFIRNGLLTDIKTLAIQMYFPTGQIEADGLSVISGEMWASTYLLLCIHKRMREADFHDIRSAYSSLAWDSGQVYRETLRFHQIFHEFRQQIVPLWREIDKLAGVPENNDFVPAETTKPVPGNVSLYSGSKGRTKWNGMHRPPPSLPSVRVSDELVMQNSLALRIIPERKFADITEMDFNELEYGRQIEIIKELLGKPAEILMKARAVLKTLALNLLNDGISIISSSLPDDDDITCTRAIKILTETLKLLYKEVKLTPSLRFDICENIRATSDDMQSFLAYTDWVISKISEFHSMLRLCYNFALLCFDLDLPSFERVLMQEKMSEDVFKYSSKSGVSAERLEDEQLEFKVISLTRMMMEASTSFSSMQKQGGIDEDFEWEDFYKTDYHLVLQRLPLRLGFNLLQFSAQEDAKLVLHQHLRTANPNFSTEQLLTDMPRKLRSIYRKKQRQARECATGSDCTQNQQVPILV